MRIVHLARDEKFIPLMRGLFEAALPGRNHWLVARRSRTALRHVAPADDITDRAEWWWRTPLVARDVAGADVIIAHSMTTIFAHAIRHARPTARVAWLGWGYEYYPLLAAQLGPAVLPATRALAGLAVDDDDNQRRPSALAKVADRLHTMCVLPPETALLRAALPQLRAQSHDLPLFTAEDVFARGDTPMDGPDVLLGNSATPTNNHAEAIELLAGCMPAGRVVAPLSYGDAAYGHAVARLGTQHFGERFDALLSFMPIEQYNLRTAACGFVLMNHRRQQGVGNIGAALYRGATVYLRAENPLVAFYRGLGLHVRTVDDLASAGRLVPIDAARRLENRARIGAYYARDRVLQAIRTLPALTG